MVGLLQALENWGQPGGSFVPKVTSPTGQGRGRAPGLLLSRTLKAGLTYWICLCTFAPDQVLGEGQAQKVGELPLKAGPSAHHPGPWPRPGVLQSRGSHPLVKTLPASPRGGVGRVQAWDPDRKRCSDGCPEWAKGWAPGRGSRGDWQLLCSPGGTGRSQLVHVKNSSGAGLSRPPPPPPSSPPSSLLPSPPLHPPIQLRLQPLGEPLTFREQGQHLRAGAGTPTGRGAQRPSPGPRTPVSPAGGAAKEGRGGPRGAGEAEQR